MSAGMPTQGLRLEQAPPLAVPLSFFLSAPFALAGAGLLLVYSGAALLATRFAGMTAALTHVGTLGFLGSVMLGALYQMTPVVAGAPVPRVRLAHLVHVSLVLGVVFLAIGLSIGSRRALHLGVGLLALSLATFIVPVGIALIRAPARGPTVHGMRIALLGLGTLLVLGAMMGYTRGSLTPVPRYADWMLAHLALGLTVWIGGLISAVSFQVVPMFYLCPAYPAWLQRSVTLLVSATLVALVGVVVLGLEARWTAIATAPAAFAVWVLHPVVTLRAMSRRRRRRPEPSLWFWRAGLALALLCAPMSTLAVVLDDFRWPVLLGWSLIMGWAGLIVHGMLTRIVPFLVWFHRFSTLVGHAPVPPMRQLLPDKYAKVGLGVHLSTLVVGSLAITTGADIWARATGAGLVLTGAALLSSLLRVLRSASPSTPATTA